MAERQKKEAAAGPSPAKRPGTPERVERDDLKEEMVRLQIQIQI